jgi:hypothetical protein
LNRLLDEAIGGRTLLRLKLLADKNFGALKPLPDKAFGG